MSLWTRLRDAVRPTPQPRRRQRRGGLIRRIANVFTGQREPERKAPERERPRTLRTPDYEPYEPPDEPDIETAHDVEAALIMLGLDDDLASDWADIVDLILRTSP